MKLRYIVTLCVGILVFLMLGNSLLKGHSRFSNGNSKMSEIHVQKVKWDLGVGKDSQEVKIYAKSMSIAQREKIKFYISSDHLNTYKIIEPVYKGNNRFAFKFPFRKTSTYYINAYLNEQTIGTKIFQADKKVDLELYPTSILTMKQPNYHVTLLFNSLQTNKNNVLTFDFNQFKSHHPRLKNHQIYVVSEDGSFFKSITNSSQKTKQKYELTFPKEGMYVIFYEFVLNNKKENFQYIIDVKDKVN